jgi:RNA polymerase sigma factor (sigma-70 family)
MRNEQIIELFSQGKVKKASEKLYTYFPVVKKLILKNQGSLQDAEDVYQEALVILFRKLSAPDFQLTSSLNTYLYSVCRYLWSDELKKRNKLGQANLGANPDSMVYEDYSDDVRKESEYRQAETAFSMLGDKCRELLKLFYFNKMSMALITVKLGFSSEKLTKNQKYRCIEKAKDHLQSLKSKNHE